MPFHLDKKVLYAGFTYFFSNFLRKSIDLKAFHAFGSNLLSLAGFFLLSVLSKEYWFEVFFNLLVFLLLAAFSLKFLVLAVNLSGKSKA